MARVHAVPAVELGDSSKMNEPVHLDCLPVVPRRICRNPVAYIGYLLQLGLPLRIAFPGSHFLSKQGMALREEDCSVAGDIHSLEFLLLVSSLRVIDVVQGGDFVSNYLLDVEESPPVHLAVHCGVACSPLLHELGEYTCVIRLFPLLGHVVEDSLALGLACPVRDDLLLVNVYILLADEIWLEFTGVQHVKVLD